MMVFRTKYSSLEAPVEGMAVTVPLQKRFDVQVHNVQYYTENGFRGLEFGVSMFTYTMLNTI